MRDKTCGCGFHSECYVHCNHELEACPGKEFKADEVGRSKTLTEPQTKTKELGHDE